MTEICIKFLDDKKARIIDCDTGKEIDICSICGVKSGRKKRTPSKYNIFIGRCMKGKSGPVPARMKECSAEWKKNKSG